MCWADCNVWISSYSDLLHDKIITITNKKDNKQLVQTQLRQNILLRSNGRTELLNKYVSQLKKNSDNEILTFKIMALTLVVQYGGSQVSRLVIVTTTTEIHFYQEKKKKKNDKCHIQYLTYLFIIIFIDI